MSGTLEAIWIKRERKGSMDPVDAARLVRDAGLAGDANLGRRRQVTIIEAEVFQNLKEGLSHEVEPVMRRANLLVRGVRLRDTSDHVLTVGGCRILIRGETRPCQRMDEAVEGLCDALDPDWRGGAFGDVLDDGEIRLGDAVTLAPPGQEA